MRKNFTRTLLLLPVCLLVSISGLFAQAPVINSFSPLSGKVGSTVVITGSAFNASAANDIVFFGSTAATVTAASTTSLTVTVPAGAATNATISVTNLATALTGNSKQPYNLLFPSTGVPSFTAKTDFSAPAGEGISQVACGDIDGDGKPDLVVANGFAGLITIYRNTSTLGSTSFVQTTLTAATPFFISLADLNGDGKLDVVAATNNANGTNAAIYKNTSTVGNISFAPKIDVFSVNGFGTNATAIADLNGDGKPDIITTNFDNAAVIIYANTSTGGNLSFGAKQQFACGNQPQSVVCGDIDGDGKIDIAVSNKTSNTVSIFQNISTGTTIALAAKIDLVTNTNPCTLAIGDLDGDGKPELALSYFNVALQSLFLNTSVPGTLSFATRQDLAATAQDTWVTMGDFSGDGKMDLIFTNPGTSVISLYKNTSTTGSLSFTKTTLSDGSNGPSSVIINDLDGDGKPDLFTSSQGASNVSSFLNTASLNAPAGVTNGVLLWLDASDIDADGNAGNNPANNATLTTWKDKTGLGNDATTIPGQTGLTYLTNQVNGKPVAHFTRSSDVTGSALQVPNVDIRATANPAITMFTVYKTGTHINDGGQGQALWGNDNGNWDRFFYNSWAFTDDGIVSLGTVNPTNVAVTGAGTPGALRLMTAVYNNQVTNGSAIYFNGAVVTTFTDHTDLTDAQTNLKIGLDGDNGAFNGDIAEMLVYGRKLTDCEILAVNQYLGAKYGVTFTSATITAGGATAFCQGGSVTLTASTGTSYQWFKNAVLIPSATAITYAATQTGSYTVAVTTSGCTATSLPIAITAFTVPTVAAITGTTSVCLGSTTQLNDVTTGGTWGTNAPGVATVDNTGKVTGLSSGTAVISYSVSNASNCVTVVTATVTVNAFPSVPAITGILSVCAGATTQLNDATTGGSWSTGNPSFASVNTNGLVSGIASGIATINYAVTASGCTTTISTTVLVNSLPVATITAQGPTSFCPGGSVTLKSTGSSLGNALSFNGNNQYVNVSSTSSINNLGLSGFTLEAWVNPTDMNDARSIFRKTGDYNLYVYNGSVAVEIWPNGMGNSTWIKLLPTAANVIQTNTWSHVAATWNAQTHTGKLYINGVEVSSQITNDFISGSEPLLIGRSSIYGNPFSGKMDELRIWNTPRTATEIANSMNSFIASNTPHFVAYYKFDEGAGSTTADATGNGNNGTLINNPAWVIPSDVPVAYSNYLWTPGNGTNSTVNANATGNYTLKVTDVNGCSATSAPVSVTVNPLPTATASSVNVACAGGNSGSITVTATSGTAPYQYSINGGSSYQSSNIFNGLTVGSYSVFIKDANTCANAVGTVTISLNPDLTAPTLNGVPSNTTAECSSVPAMATVTASDNCAVSGSVNAEQFPSSTLRALLVHSYNYNANAGDSKGSATATNVNGVTFTTGITGNAAQFNGSNYFDYGTTSSLNGTVPFAISVWVKTASAGGQTVIQQRDGNVNGQYILNIGANHAGTVSAPGQVYFMVFNSTFQFEIYSSNRVDDNQWHHIVAERDGANGRVYIDGILRGSASGPIQALNSGIGTYVGKDVRDGTKNFIGQIDELKIFAGNGTNCTSTYDLERTWSVKDASNNQTAAQQIISVQDTQAPVLSTAPADVTVECNAVPAGATLTATDNCDGAPTVTYTEVRTNGASVNDYVLTRTWTAKDACGNTSSKTQIVTVHDTQAPSITAPATVTVILTSGNCSATGVALGTPVTSDNCSSVTVTNNAPAVYPVGNTTVIWTAKDVSNNTSTATQTVTVISPEINLTGNSVSIPKGDVTPSTGDNTDFGGTLPNAAINKTFTIQNTGTYPLTVSAINVSGTNASEFTVSGISLPATIAAGGSSSFVVTFNSPNVGFRTATVTVNSNDCDEASYDFAVKAQITCTMPSFANTNVYLQSSTSASSCDAVVNYPLSVSGTPAPNVSYTFSGATSGTGTGTGSGKTFNQGITHVVVSATNPCGTVTTEFDVTVVDDVKPIVVSKNITISLDQTGHATFNVNDLDGGSHDNCGPVTFGLNHGTICGTAAEGSNVTLQAPAGSTIDNIVFASYGTPNGSCGNFTLGGCNATNSVSVVSGLAIGRNSVTIPASNGTFGDPCSGTVKRLDIQATYGGDGITNVFSCANIGNNTVTFIVTDAAGNTSTGTAIVTVVDAQAPTVVTKNITVNLDANGQATITPAQVNNGSNDNCGIASVSLNKTTFNCADVLIGGGGPAYQTFTANGTFTVPSGVTNVRVLVIGGGGGGANGHQAGGGSGYVSTGSYAVTAGQNVSVTVGAGGTGALARPDNDITGLTPGASSSFGSLASANGGGTSTGINTPGGNGGSGGGGSCNGGSNGGAGGSGGSNGGSCTYSGGIGQGSYLAALALFNKNTFAAGAGGAGGTSTHSGGGGAGGVVLNATGPNGGNGSQSFSGKGGIGYGSAGGAGGYNSTTDPTTRFAGGNGASGLVYIEWDAPAGTQVTLTVVDNSGNSASGTALVTVVDNIAPTIVCPAPVTVECASAVPAPAPASITANDNCSAVVTFVSDVISNQTAPNKYTITRTYKATDPSGNATTCTQTITVNDVTPPVIVCPAPIVASNDNNQCSSVQTWAMPVATDNCSGTVTVIQTAGLPSGSAYPIGVNTITLKATDASGNTATCSFTITVNDTQNPVIVNKPSGITQANDAGVCGAIVTWPAVSVSDNCPGAILVSDHHSGDLYPVGNTTVTYTATDAAGNSVTSGFVVTVNDTEKPTIISAGDQTQANDAGDCGANVTVVSPATHDNCDVLSVTNSYTGTNNASGHYPFGTTTITWTVTDIHNNTQTTTQTVTVSDNEKPVITNVPSNITVNALSQSCNTLVGWTKPTATDNCGIASFTSDDAFYEQFGFTLLSVGVHTITYTATDIHGNIKTTSFTVTVVDNQLPIITGCPGDITVNAEAGKCDNVVIWNPPTASDNCPGVSLSTNHISGERFPVGTTVVTYTATDHTGLITTCSFNVTVVDDQLPMIACPAAISVSNDAGQCGATVAIVPATATDNCPGVTVAGTRSDAQPLNALYPVGTTTITWTATDAHAHTATCTQVITVTDNENPVINCAATINHTANTGLCSYSFTPTPAAASDNCPGVTVTGSRSDAQALTAPYPVGTTTITWTASDVHGHSVSCTQAVTITDDENPVLNCPSNITHTADAGVCSYSFTPATPTATDNCPGVTVTGSRSDAQPLSAAYPSGTTTITWKATDAHGHTVSCTQTVTVTDNEKPTIICATNQTVNLDANCSGVLPDYRSLLTVNDNCTPANALVITQSPAAGTVLNGTGTTTVTFTVSDAAGNNNTCNITVTKKDVTPPTIVCASPIAVNNDADKCGAVVTYTAPTATDNCASKPNVLLLANDQASWVAQVKAGLLATNQFDAVDVFDISSGTPTLAQLKAYKSVLLWTDGGPLNGVQLGNTLAAYIDGGGGVVDAVFDNASIPVSGNYNTSVYRVLNPQSQTQGDRRTLGAVLLPSHPIMQGVNSFDGGSASYRSTSTSLTSGSYTIAQYDNGELFIMAKENVGTSNARRASLNFFPPNTISRSDFWVSTTDGSKIMANALAWVGNGGGGGGSVTVAQTGGLPSGSLFPVGTTTNTFVATDASGNTATCSFTVTVTDTQKPTITAAPDQTQTNDAGDCGANVTVVAPSTHDNCAVQSVTNSYTGTNNASGHYPVGTTVITWTVTDIHNNTQTTTQSITVTDNEKPTMTAAPDQTQTNDAGDCGANVTVVSPATHDNCDVLSVTNSYTGTNNASGHYPVGTTVITWTVTDIHNNTQTTTQSITVTDDEKPMITAAPDQTQTNDAGDCGANVTVVSPATHDNCDVLSVTNSYTRTNNASGHYPVGTTVITWTVTDIHNNTQTTTQSITVTDDEKPTITAAPDQTQTNDAGDCGANVTVVSPATHDNCDVLSVTNSYTGTNNASGHYPVGTTVITWTVTDIHNNTQTTTQSITVTDDEKPTITAAPDQTQTSDAGKCGANVNVVSPATHDNCDVLSVTNSYTNTADASGYYPVGTTVITWTVTDIHNNTQTTTQSITVTDDEKPTITAAPDQTQTNDAGKCGADVTVVSPATHDNCDVLSVTNSYNNTADASGYYPVGTTVITWTVTDIHNNTQTTTQSITVTDDEKPTITAAPDQTQTNDAGKCGANVTVVPPATHDNCDVLSVTNSYNNTADASGFYPVGTTVITWTVTDIHNNTQTTTQSITVTDDEKPTITAAPDQTQTNDAGNCGANVTVVPPATHDNCDVLSVTNSYTGTNNASGHYPVGTTVITWTVTDIHNNTQTTTQSITVTDDEKPTIISAGDQTQTNDAGDCGAIVTVVGPTTHDNCDVLSVTNSYTGTNNASGHYPVGTTVITWTVTDIHNNTQTTTQSITVTDDEKPTITAAPAQTQTNDAGDCGAVVTVAGPTTHDNCAVQSVTNSYNNTSNASGHYPVGTTVITWTVTDTHGNTQTTTQSITVTDNEKPVLIGVPANATVECSAVPAPATVTASDNCSTSVPSYSQTRTNGNCPSNYTLTRVWSTTDASGNTTTATQVITVQDTKAPVLSAAPGNMTVECDAVPAPAVLTATDNCDAAPVVTYTETRTNGSSPSNYTLTRVWKATDACGNSCTKTQVITVRDTKAPVPTVAVLPTINAECSVSVTAPTATDNCAGTITATTLNPTSYTAQGTYLITWSYNDGNGNISTQTQSVVVKDVTAPVAVLPTLTGQCSVTATKPIATDNCIGPVTGTTTDPLTYTVQGTYTIHWKFDDGRGNIGLQNQTVIVKDNIAPVPTVATLPTLAGDCSVNIIVRNDGGCTDGCACCKDRCHCRQGSSCNCRSNDWWNNWWNDANNGCDHDDDNTVFYVQAPTALDNCVGTVTGTTTDPLHYNTQGTYIIHWNFTDGRGNTSVQNQTVVVKDDEAPIPWVSTLPSIYGQCSVSLTLNSDWSWWDDDDDDNGYDISAPWAWDNCAGWIRATTSDPLTYSGQGTYTIHWKFDDGHSNITIQNQLVIIKDVTAPKPNQNNLPTLTGTCSVTVTTKPTAKDNCAGIITATTTDPLTYTGDGTYTIHWTYNDGNGNITTQTQKVVIDDDVKPVITDPADITISCGASTLPSNTGTATATDNCSGVTVTYSDQTNGNVTTRTWKATDAAGNTATSTQKITVVDNTKPVLTTPNSVTINCGSSTAPAATGTATATDNCSTATVTYSDATSGNTITRTWKATDASGNYITGVQTISIVDNIKPVLTVPNSTTVNCGGSTSPSATGTATATDNCSVPSVTYSDVTTGNTITRTWKATDASGNFVTGIQTITTVDNTKPNITDPKDVTVSCGNSTDPSATGKATATDNCSVPTVTYSDATSGNTITRTWTATDASGNTASSTQVITIVDNTKPTISDVSDVTVNCGASTDPSVTGTPTASDACSAVVLTHTDATNSNTITRTWKATDASGNYATSVQTITVGSAFTASVTSVPTSSVYTGGVPTNLYLGYGAQGTTLQMCSLPSAGAPYTYAWTGTYTSRLNNTNTAAPTFTPTSFGYYTFNVTVTNKYGCTSTANIAICVTDIRVAGTSGSGAKVYVCHTVTSGHNSSTQTLQVLISQVPAHIGNNTCGSNGNDRLGSCDQSPCNTAVANSIVSTTSTVTKDGTTDVATTEEELKVTVMPNPTTTYFTLKLESKYETPVNMRVMDARGRVIDAKSKIGSNSTIQIGHNYASGTYYAELIQGNTRKVVQMIKGRG